jgi:hypothetical protein
VILSTFAPAVTGMGAAIMEALADTAAGAPERGCLIVPGAIAADGCDCGQLALSVARKYPSYSFPTEAIVDEADAGCPPPILAAVVTVSLLRCIPGIDDDGTPPSCAELQAAAIVQDIDDATIRRALACYLHGLADQGRIIGYVIGATVANGPQGNCGGSDTTVTIGINNCGCS